MIVLVLNSGSSSLKFQLLDMSTDQLMVKGLVERIGSEKSQVEIKVGANKHQFEAAIPDHQDAVARVVKALVSEEIGVLKDLKEIGALGHRVAHGGEYYAQGVVITDEVKANIRTLIDLAPLHNAPALLGIEACEAVMPGVPQVAVFDTAFHQTMPEEAYLYGIDYKYYEKYDLRRYGFHGTSHKYVAQEAAKYVGRDIADLKIITCHLGNGASITAIDGGKVQDTSMGFTPLEGLLMGTRSGNIDPAAVLYLMDKENMSTATMLAELNKNSGVLGVSGGISNDFRDLEVALENPETADAARRALGLFMYRIKGFVGNYAAVLNGVDIIVFTAGIGENDPMVRRKVCSDMTYLGVAIDEEKNQNITRGVINDISAPDARVKVLVVPTDEELVIARETVEALAGK